MTALPARTPFEPLPRVPAEAPLALAVLAATLPFFHWAFGELAPHALAVAISVAAAGCSAVFVAAAVRGRTGIAAVALAGAHVSVLTVAWWNTGDAVLSVFAGIPLSLVFAVAFGPLVLAARARRAEPDALEHHAVTGAVWLLLATTVFGPASSRAPHAVAALLAGGALARDVFRAWWLRRVRRGAIAGVRLGAPWPGATARLELAHTGGDGPFRSSERVDRSEIVEVRWARMAVSVAVLGVLAWLTYGG